MYSYILCEFEYGYTGLFYQEILQGTVVRYTDLDGNTLELEGAYGSHVVDPEPPRPDWAQ